MLQCFSPSAPFCNLVPRPADALASTEGQHKLRSVACNHVRQPRLVVGNADATPPGRDVPTSAQAATAAPRNLSSTAAAGLAGLNAQALRAWPQPLRTCASTCGRQNSRHGSGVTAESFPCDISFIALSVVFTDLRRCGKPRTWLTNAMVLLKCPSHIRTYMKFHMLQ